MALIDQLDKYHLCYLIVNDIADDRYAGLSHVAEHTLLIPSDIGIDFSGRGYTCANHVWLCFDSEKLETVVEVDRKIYSGEIFNKYHAAFSEMRDNLEKKTINYSKVTLHILNLSRCR